MEIVSFINTQKTGKGDLILTFAIEDVRFPAGIRSLILLRCPATDALFEERERGITVSMEGEKENRSDIAGNLLAECTLDAAAGTIRVASRRHTYELDIRRIKPASLAKVWPFLAEMNFDNKAVVAGLGFNEPQSTNH